MNTRTRSNNFDVEHDLGQFAKSVRGTVLLADALSWTIRWANVNQKNKGVSLRSPSGDKNINVPMTNVNANRAKSWMNQIITHSTTSGLIAISQSLSEMDVNSDKKIAEMAGVWGVLVDTAISNRMSDAVARADGHIVDQETAVAVAMREAQAQQNAEPEPTPEPTPAAPIIVSGPLTCPECGFVAAAAQGLGSHRQKVHGVVGASRSKAGKGAETEHRVTRKSRGGANQRRVTLDVEAGVLAETPWMARRGSKHKDGAGVKYEHPYIGEQVMTDGAVRYVCDLCRTFIADNGKSVGIHIGRTHPDRKREERVPVTVENYGEVTHRPIDARARHLANEIVAALDSVNDWQSMDSAALSLLIAHQMIEARPDRAPVAPLTPEQIIARISGLISGPEIANLHAQVDLIREELAGAVQRADAAEGEASNARAESVSMRENLSALRDLLEGIGQ